MIFIFTDHADRRFNKRFAQLIKHNVIKTLKAVAKVTIPNVISTKSYMKNLNKSNIHFFLSKEKIFFVCQEKKQRDDSYAMIVITVFDDSDYQEQLSFEEQMVEYYLEKKEEKEKEMRLIQKKKKTRNNKKKQKTDQEKSIQRTQISFSKIKSECVFFIEAPFCKIKKIITLYNISVSKFNKQYNLLFQEQLEFKRILRNNDNCFVRDTLILNFINKLKEFCFIDNEKLLINHFLIKEDFNESYNEHIESYKQIINQMVFCYENELLRIIIHQNKKQYRTTLDSWRYVLKNCKLHDVFINNQEVLLDNYSKDEKANKNKLQNKTDLVYRKDLEISLNRLRMASELNLVETVSNRVEKLIEFYSFTNKKMIEFDLQSFNPNY